MKNMCATLIAGLVLCAGSAAFAQNSTGESKKAQPASEKATQDKGEKKEKKAEGLKIGDAAPDFTVTDTDGKTHKLSDLTKQGKIVVLQWFNAECPYVQKHYGDAGSTFNDIVKNYESKGVVLIAINSNAKGKPGSGKETNMKAKDKWNMAYPIGLDESGEIGMAYGAKNTPAMYIIDKNGTLAYQGAIDDDKGGDKPGKTNYVTKALHQLLAGETVTTAETKPYGCGVKYAK